LLDRERNSSAPGHHSWHKLWVWISPISRPQRDTTETWKKCLRELWNAARGVKRAHLHYHGPQKKRRSERSSGKKDSMNLSTESATASEEMDHPRPLMVSALKPLKCEKPASIGIRCSPQFYRRRSSCFCD
jgi:hypothetical protein